MQHYTFADGYGQIFPRRAEIQRVDVERDQV